MIRMNEALKGESNHLIWIQSDDFYQEDIWSLVKPMFYVKCGF